MISITNLNNYFKTISHLFIMIFEYHIHMFSLYIRIEKASRKNSFKRLAEHHKYVMKFF